MSQEVLPLRTRGERRTRSRFNPRTAAVSILLTLLLLLSLSSNLLQSRIQSAQVPLHAAQIIAKCRALETTPGPSPLFHQRSTSDRFQPGTKPVLIRNASILTGNEDGREVIHGDILLERGLVTELGSIDQSKLQTKSNLVTVDAHGAWVSPGIVDIHSHLGVQSSPSLAGSNDGNSFNGPVLPWLRALDGLNTHDEGLQHSVSGGVTTSLILPGSANAIGGQGFVIKLRPTLERSSSALILEPPFNLNSSAPEPDLPLRWRHMKHACGENPSLVYSMTRMDTVWSIREAYNKARQIKEKQDAYCSSALRGEWAGLKSFPEELKWEALVDVLRGKVKVQTHCYEAVDIDAFIRLSNEFKFSVAAFHHAHEAYLVPDVLKRAYGRPPAAAIFAAFGRYKRESYRQSVYAPRILADNGIRVVMKSDHPAIVSRYLLHEAQQAHYYGLPGNIALSSVTTVPADVLGLDHRIGYVRKGYDADLVIWDSHPLSLGATPIQVYIDGIAQLGSPYLSTKPASHQTAPDTPNFDKEIAETIKHEGLPPLEAQSIVGRPVVFTNVSRVWMRGPGGVREVSAMAGTFVVIDGEVVCSGGGTLCAHFVSDTESVFVDLQGGSVSPGLVTFGSQVGLQEIQGESSTVDGFVDDPLSGKVPSILGGEGSIIHAIDGLQFGTRDALQAYRSGVTSAITPPASGGFLAGLSVSFSLAAGHKLQAGAINQEVAAVHVAVQASGPSVSSQIASLRRALLCSTEGERGAWFHRASEGIIPLVVTVHKADIMATLLLLKQEVEQSTGKTMKMTFAGATEAHLLAKEIGAAKVGIILTPPRSYPYAWEHRRILYGPPITSESALLHLFLHNVTVGIGPQGIMGESTMSSWAVGNLRFDAAWAQLESDGRLTHADALAIASSNIEDLLGVRHSGDLGMTQGGDLLSFDSKVVAATSVRRKTVDLF